MKITFGLLGAGMLLLSACGTPTNVVPDTSGGSVAEMGPGYCDAPPADMDQMDHWNQLCSSGRR